jgi:hypothetical protein
MPGIWTPPSPGAAPRYKSVVGTNPAANTELADVVPAGKWWWLLSVTVSCVQAATQTPQPALIIDDGSINIYTSVGSTTAQSVSTTVQYTWGIGLPLTGLVGATPNIVTTAPLAEFFFLGPGFHIKTLTAGIGANTDYGAFEYYVCEFTL